VNALTFTSVTAGYGSYKALNDVSLSIADGESVALLGRNGAGKSTVARVASALVRPTAGVVAVVGRDPRVVGTVGLARAGFVHLPEGAGLFRHLSVEENLVLRAGGSSRRQRAERLAWALDHLGDLASRRGSPAGELSGGQQRRVAVVAALASEPRLLVADEPTLGLSPAAAATVATDLRLASERGCTLVVIESKVDFVVDLCPRAIVLDRGVVTHDGATSDATSALRAQFSATSSDSAPAK